MAKRSFQAATYTPTAQTDGSNLTNGTYQAIGAGNNSSGLLVSEIYIGGQASASSVNIMQFARDSQLGATTTALAAPNSDGPLNTLSAAAQPGASITYVAATTSPNRSNTTTSARLTLSLNTFGGIVRWVAYPGEEWGIIGTGVSISESTLSAYSGGSVGLMGSHIIYETY